MSTLLNIWREFGAYLRYANAQNLALLAINGGLWSLIVGLAKQDTVSIQAFLASQPQHHYLIFSAFIGFSQLCLFVSLIPRLSLERYSFKVAACRTLGLISKPKPVDERNAFYFLDVADFSTHVEFSAFLQHNGITSRSDCAPAELALCSQIHTVAKICTRKMATFVVALLLSGLGLASLATLAFWS